MCLFAGMVEQVYLAIGFTVGVILLSLAIIFFLCGQIIVCITCNYCKFCRHSGQFFMKVFATSTSHKYTSRCIRDTMLPRYPKSEVSTKFYQAHSMSVPV